MSDNISTIAIEDKMKDAYLSYSLSVIVGRALPDVRDGLKPVHRRILYASSELGLTHDKSHKKSARIVGEVLGKYHPHGDRAVYDAMVRMAQSFNQRYRLIDGHGNFGSIDGDSPAAMRYTEARLTSFAETMLADIKQDTVEFEENFDGSLQEPLVLPSRIPNLLANGSSGIAVGMSTSIPPHNLGELIDGLIYLLENPEVKTEKLIENFIPGPDFPTGAKIIGDQGIKKAYRTGKGKIVLRANTTTEKNGRKKQLIINEIPFQVNKANLIEEIADLVNKEKVKNISDVRDESDQEGLRIVLELKSGADEQIVLNRLYKYSSLQKNYRINLLALVDHKPEVMDLKTILQHFINFRRKIITRRTKHDLKNAQKKYKIRQGLLKAISKLDLVISIIRGSQSTNEARKSLMKELEITQEQAQSILEMRLQRLVGMQVDKIKKEISELENEIKKYKKILNMKKELDQVLKEELQEVKNEFADKRKTEIIADEKKATIKKQDLIKEKNAVISLSLKQNIKRTDSRKNIRSGKNDHIINIVYGKSLDTLLFFNQLGKVYNLPIHDLPEHHGLSTGNDLSEYIQIPLHEKIIKMICLNNKTEEKYITMATSDGIIKKTLGKDYKTTYTSIKAIKLNKNSRVVATAITDGTKELLLGTRQGQTIRFKESEIRDTGRNTIGSRGIKLKDSDQVISMNIIEDKPQKQFVVSITESGKANKSRLKEFTLQKRNGKGLKTTKSDSYKIEKILTAKTEDEIIISTDKENLHTIKVEEIKETQRPGYMYDIIDLAKDEKIENIYLLPQLNNN
ncbi:MAG: DNA gyrase subunit A [Bacillota bacterium]